MIAGKTAILPRVATSALPPTSALPLRLHGRHVCIRADGVCLRARIEPGAGCILVSIGATPGGRTALRGFQVGIRVFATVRHRTLRPKRALSQKTVKRMVFTLVRAAAQK